MKDDIAERRKSSRFTYPGIIQCSQCISDGKIIKYDSPLEIQVFNISSDGLCISTSELFKEGAILDFDIALEDTTPFSPDKMFPRHLYILSNRN